MKRRAILALIPFLAWAGEDAPALRKVGAFGDPLHFVVTFEDGLACGVSAQRLRTFRLDNVVEVLDSHWSSSRTMRVLAVHERFVYVPRAGAVDILHVNENGELSAEGHVTVGVRPDSQIVVRDAFLYCPDGPGKALRRFSLETPRTPQPDDVTELGVELRRFQLVGKRAYVLAHGELLVADVSAWPGTVVGRTPVESKLAVGALMVAEPWAYAFTGHQITTFDVSDPAEPKSIAVSDRKTWCSHVRVRNGRFLCYGMNGVYEHIVTPDGALRDGRHHHNEVPGCLLPGDEADYFVGSDMVARECTGTEDLNREPDLLALQAENVVVDSGVAYAFRPGLRILDMSDPSVPNPLGAVNANTSHRTVTQARDGYLYTFAQVIDVRNPQAARVTAREGYGSGLSVDGATLYTVKENKLTAWHLGYDPGKPRLGKVHALDAELAKIVVSRRIAWVALKQRYVRAYRVGRDYSLTLLSETEVAAREDGLVLDLAYEDDRLYVAMNDAGVLCLDVSDPEAPQRYCYYDTPQFAEKVRVRSGIACVADGSGGVVVLDMREPGQGVVLASHPTSDWTHSLDLCGIHILAAESDGGLAVYECSVLPSERPREPENVLGKSLEEVGNLIRRLGAPTYPQREKAMEDIDALMPEARPYLRKRVATEDDPEIRLRLRQLLAAP